MDILNTVRGWIGALVAVALTLVPLALVLQVLFGPIPGIGNVVANLMTIVKDVASNGLFGLISIFIIIWLFSFLNLRRS